MSNAAKSQLVYLLRILEYCGKINIYVSGFADYEDFFSKGEQLYFNASLTMLVQIGEQTTKVDEPIKSKAPAIPWPVIRDSEILSYMSISMWMQKRYIKFVLSISLNYNMNLKYLSVNL